MLYRFGMGVDSDLTKANEYFEKSKSYGGSDLILEQASLTTAEQWGTLGDYYYYARNAQKQNYVNALYCYYMAWAFDSNYLHAFYMIGWQYQHGQGVDKNLVEARWFYEKATKEVRSSQ
ncbi:MAG: hypothetical protein WBE18_08525 [Gammaproteobacteria bacterium]